MRPRLPLGRTPLIALRSLAGRLHGRDTAAPLVLTCYGKAECSLCDKAKVPVARIVRASGGQITADWVDIQREPTLNARWGERIPVVCVGETILAEGKVSELWLRRALDTYRRDHAGEASADV